MCATMGIELGKDRIADALKKVAEFSAARAPVAPETVTPSAASEAWNALRDLTDPLGEDGAKIMAAARIFAQRQYECGLAESAARAPVVAAGGVPDGREALVTELLDLLQFGKGWPSYYFNHRDLYECCDCGGEHEDYAEIEHKSGCSHHAAVASVARKSEIVELLRAPQPPAPAATADAHEGMAAEYQRWIDFFHAGNGSYDDFLRIELNPERAALAAQQKDTP
jgi:hypothetical protein